MRDRQQKNMGRSPQRSEAVSGDEAKGLTPIPAERTVQPEAVNPASTARSLRPLRTLSLPARRAGKPADGSATPGQA